MSEQRQNENRRVSISILVLALMLAGQAAAGQGRQTVEIQPTASAHQSQRLLIVSIPDRRLVLLEDGVTKRIYPVAVGKPSTPSPSGSFNIVRRVSNPTYSHKGLVVGAGPKNPVGSRWMGLSLKGYGIHGTNEPSSIGKAASHGCIRMAKADLEELYAQVQVGDAVEIHAEHDAVVELALDQTISAPPAPTPPALLVAGNGKAPNTGTMTPIAAQ
jgi:lipoprotein-anchoring transpeptidase ErfK/SrfK